LLPAADPERAKIAIAIENHQRFRRRDSYSNTRLHKALIILPPQTRQFACKRSVNIAASK
jgi:hypothetical protein